MVNGQFGICIQESVTTVLYNTSRFMNGIQLVERVSYRYNRYTLKGFDVVLRAQIFCDPQT